MKMKLYKCFAIIMIAAFGMVGFTSCGDDKYITEEHNYYGPDIITRDFEVLKNDWYWNSVYNRYECMIEVKEINEALYEYGTVVGTVFIKEKDTDGNEYEVQKNLPFVQTYKDLAVPYTEIISYDISYGSRSYVTFFIQATDGSTQSPYLMTYYFKVAFIWDSEG